MQATNVPAHCAYISYKLRGLLRAPDKPYGGSAHHGGEEKSTREIMWTMLLAALAALSVGMGAASASSGGNAAKTQFTEIPDVLA